MVLPPLSWAHRTLRCGWVCSDGGRVRPGAPFACERGQPGRTAGGPRGGRVQRSRRMVALPAFTLFRAQRAKWPKGDISSQPLGMVVVSPPWGGKMLSRGCPVITQESAMLVTLLTCVPGCLTAA